MRFWLYPLVLAGAASVFAGQLTFDIDDKKEATGFQNKTFQGKGVDMPSFKGGKENTMFDKTFNAPQANWNKEANIGGHDILAPELHFDKTYPAQSASDWVTRSAQGMDRSSSIPNRTSRFADIKRPDGFDRTFEVRTYEGPEAARIKNNVAAVSNGLSGMKDVPDRNLTIDEVKNILNRDTTPQKPAADLVPEKSDSTAKDSIKE